MDDQAAGTKFPILSCAVVLLARSLMAAGVGRTTVYVFERGIVPQSAWILNALRDAFQSAGVEFMASGGATGGRMREPQ